MGTTHPYDDVVQQSTGLRRAVGLQVKAAVRALMVQTVSDRVAHAEMLGMGNFTFRGAFSKDMGSFYLNNRIGCDNLADLTFRFFEVNWRERYLTEGAMEFDGLTPGRFLDSLAPISPPTPEEIDASWELEIASDEASMRQNYEGSARVRKGSDLGSVKVKPS